MSKKISKKMKKKQVQIISIILIVAVIAVALSVSFGFFGVFAGSTILRPNANGINNNWEPFPTWDDNWECVNDEIPDGMMTMVFCSEFFGADFYDIVDPIDELGTIARITLHAVISADASGRQYQIKIRGGDKPSDFADSGKLSTTVIYPDEWEEVTYTWTTNPWYGDTWSWDNLTNLQIGIQLWSERATIYCTQMYLEIVYELPPVADFTYSPEYPIESEEITFTGTSTGIVSEWHWDFGDGTEAKGNVVYHTYIIAGVYEVTLTVTGVYGSDSISKWVTVGEEPTPPPPVADFIYMPESPLAGENITFIDSSTGDVVRWNWDFGDGTTSIISSIQHSYAVAGTYNVSLMVTDSYEQTDTIIKAIIVYPIVEPAIPMPAFPLWLIALLLIATIVAIILVVYYIAKHKKKKRKKKK